MNFNSNKQTSFSRPVGDGEREPLTRSLVGALMRRQVGKIHASQQWGDPATDHLIPNLDKIAQQYTFSELLGWALNNAQATYASSLIAMWESSRVVAVAVENSVPVLHSDQSKNSERYEAVPCSFTVVEPVQQMIHELAVLSVNMSPPLRPYTGKSLGYDPEGQSSPSRRIPLATPALIQLTETGMHAAEMIEEVEKTVTAQCNGSVDIFDALVAKTCINLDLARESGVTVPDWYDPFEKHETKIVMKPSEPWIDENPYTDLTHHFIQINETMRRQDQGRLAVLSDGYFFGDLPRGVGKVAHRLDNFMTMVKDLAIDALDDRIPDEWGTPAALFPLNFPVLSDAAIQDWPEQDIDKTDLFIDGFCIPGVYRPPSQELRVLHMHFIRDVAPVVDGVEVMHSVTAWAAWRSLLCDKITATIVYAHEGYWYSEWNCIFPYDMSEGLIIVVKGPGISRHTPGHCPLLLYISLVSSFMFGQRQFVSTRKTWCSYVNTPNRLILKRMAIDASRLYVNNRRFYYASQLLCSGKKDCVRQIVGNAKQKYGFMDVYVVDEQPAQDG